MLPVADGSNQPGTAQTKTNQNKISLDGRSENENCLVKMCVQSESVQAFEITSTYIDTVKIHQTLKYSLIFLRLSTLGLLI